MAAVWFTDARALLSPLLAALPQALRDEIRLAAETAVESYVDRLFLSQSYNELQDGDGLRGLMLDQWPIVTLGQILVTEWDESITTYASTAFRFRARTGELQFKPNTEGHFSRGFQNVQVDYSAGYVTVPADVIKAATMVAVQMAADEARDHRLLGQRLGEWQENYISKITDRNEIDKLLNPYKRVTIAG